MIPTEEQMWRMQPHELRELCQSMISELETTRNQYILNEGSPVALSILKDKISYLERKQEFCCALAAYKERNTVAA